MDSKKTADAMIAASAGILSAAPKYDLLTAVKRLIKAKGRFHTEQNYADLVAAYDDFVLSASETIQANVPESAPAVQRPALSDAELLALAEPFDCYGIDGENGYFRSVDYARAVLAAAHPAPVTQPAQPVAADGWITAKVAHHLDMAQRRGFNDGWMACERGDDKAIAAAHNRVGNRADYEALFPADPARQSIAAQPVAPFAYADPLVAINFQSGAATKEWMWAKPDVGLVPLYLATPTPQDSRDALDAAEPTEEMLIAARNWSIKEYGIGVGNDAARGCWKAMYAAIASTATKEPQA